MESYELLIADTYCKMGKYRKALYYYQRIHKKFPKSSEIFLRKGITLLGESKIEDALK